MANSPRVMQCMEVWGGSEPVDSTVSLAGLDAWVFSKPYGQSESGGDIYYLSSCATGRIARMLLADVSGHGQVVASVSADLRRLMRKYVNFIDQTSFVRSMNSQFAAISDAGSFATAIAATFFAPTNDLTLCIAGHPPPLRFSVRTGAWSVMEQREDTNIPLGIDDTADWRQFGVRLEVGDLVLAYSDALIEAHGQDGQMLGIAGLLALVGQVDPAEPNRLVPRLLDVLAAAHPGNLDGDDVTVLLIRPNGAAAGTRLGTMMLAPLRVICGVARSVFSPNEPMPWPELSIANVGGALLSPLNRFWSRRNRTAPRADSSG